MARLFVAVDPPAEVRADLRRRVAILEPMMDGWRWVPEEQWHLTLAFLGEVDDLRSGRLESRLERVASRHEPLELSANGFGAFQRPARAHVFWCGVDGDREPLRRLAWSVAAAARKAGIEVEGRAYRPHLTLGRRRTPADLREVLTAEGAYAGPSFQVTEFVLVESHLGAKVRHEIRARYPLR
ncbi:MAG: RNA 2',3'-cyclic phosphodiesterase [Propionibacteriales bacterium]|nr:RNA 2',3'-cyclic phosphodiesterase [Propionibacteriales bacterium]